VANSSFALAVHKFSEHMPAPWVAQPC